MNQFNSVNQDTFCVLLKAFSTAAGKNYPDSQGGHGYAFQAGYFQSLCNELFSYLPETRQKQLIQDMTRTTRDQERRLNERNDRTYQANYHPSVF